MTNHLAGVGYERRRVPVAGGELTVGSWGKAGPLVVAAHGLTATHMCWALVGPQLGADHRFVGADLRGRGASRQLPPPYGMGAHAADLAAVVKAYGGGPAILLGHSMGGFAVARTARDHPALVERVVLVDGGAPFPLPADLGDRPGPEQLEESIAATLGPAFARLSMTFPDLAAAHQFWQGHPAFADWSAEIAAYVDYDLVGEAPQLHPACVLEAARQDARELYPVAGAAPAPLPVPATFLRAERGLLDQPEPLYPPGWPQRWLPGAEESTVAGVNHYTITLGPAGAAAVVAAVRNRPGPR
jgi:pimeloyl-ACP methyl ester carboxylesterase